MHGVDRRRAQGAADVAETTEQPEDQRRQREQGEEARLRGQPGDAVAHADPDGRDDEPGQREQARNASEHPAQRAVWPRSWANRNRRTLGGCGPTSSPTSSRPRPGSTCCAATPALSEAVDRWVAPATRRGRRSTTLGALAGTPEVRQWADQADRVTPVLRTHAPTGERVDEVEFHPAYHRLMRGRGRQRPHRRAVDPPRRTAGAHARRAAGFVVWSQVEAGHLCPVSMTYAAAPALAAEPDRGGTLAARPRLALVRPGAVADGRQGRADRRHGHDREAGRLRRAGQHDVGGGRPGRPAATATPTGSPATSGSARPR